jgi:hypothetical protein
VEHRQHRYLNNRAENSRGGHAGRGLHAWGAEAIRSLLTDPGFRDVHIRLVIQPIRYGSLEEFLPGYLAAIPMAGAVATLDEASRAALFRNVTAALHGYVDDDGLAAPMECHVVTAHV